MGVESTLRCARKSFWWPSLNSQQKQFTSSCEVCQSIKRNNQTEMTLSLTVEGILTIPPEEADKTHEVLTTPLPEQWQS
ncbi:hypothetical protein P5673_018667 [Acropora cervicornis]|uniref:Integrase zinc-binding domain-containing protein n=1 Tax=Acropora cervicornis TaxID=6130 RepID=A0AAD9QD34_ACRCE|nr:hypothetical protein P5673_018667 [Acropora cervicornis]